jgi:hypothetical protein
MDQFDISRESGAGFLGITADGNDDINSSIKIIIDGFRRMVGYVNTPLRHNCHGSGMKTGRMTAGAIYFEFVSGHMPQQAFGYLRSAGITCADENNFLFIHI